jgi:hypothetical protein
MAYGGNAAIAASDRAYASDFQAVAVRWNTARLAALSRGSQPLSRASAGRILLQWWKSLWCRIDLAGVEVKTPAQCT